MNLAAINWGSDSAESDRQLLRYFVMPSSYHGVKTFQKRFILGAKGIRKTALQLKLQSDFEASGDYLVERVSSPGTAVISSFLPVTQPEATRRSLNRQLWTAYFVRLILCRVGRALEGRLAVASDAAAREYALKLQVSNPDPVEIIRILATQIKLKLGKIGEIGLDITREPACGSEIQSSLFHLRSLLDKGLKVVVMLDDIDSQYDGTSESIDVVLSLLESVNELTTFHANLHPIVACHEPLYLAVLAASPLSDKLRDSVNLKWTDSEILEFLGKRIIASCRNTNLPISSSSEDLFYQVFPAVMDRRRSHEWIASYTMCKPRDALKLARLYSESANKMTQREALKTAARALGTWKANDLATEHMYRYPDLSQILSLVYPNLGNLGRSFTQNELCVLCDTIIAGNLQRFAKWQDRFKVSPNGELLSKSLLEIGVVVPSIRKSPRSKSGNFEIHPCLRLSFE